VRASGASTNLMPSAASSSASSSVEVGSEVEVSTMTVFARPGLEPVGPAHQPLDLRRAGDAEQDDGRGLRHFARRLHLARPALHDVLDRRPITVPHHRERITLLDDVLGHAMAHEAEPDEADAFACHHVTLPDERGCEPKNSCAK
jgi:hypothetical protein